jgi:CRISPR-associated protein (TIGR02710 family)
MKKALLVSVGGSPAPVIFTINAQQPEFLFLFVSRGSAVSAREEVIPALLHKPSIYEFVLTPDEQDIEQSVGILLSEIPKKLTLWGLSYSDLAVDYTGGTKTMSAALVLALSRNVDAFSYVGGTVRDKNNLGVVVDGNELRLSMKNPWNELAIQSLSDIQILFNACLFTSAAKVAETAREKSPLRKQVFEGIMHASTAYNNWDSFKYDRALNDLRRCESHFRQIAAETDKKWITLFYKQIQTSLPLLEKICIEQDALIKSSPKAGMSRDVDGMAMITDLVANAIRRGDIEYKYDDAVARLYSALEKMAKMKLKVAYGLDNSDLTAEQIPEELRQELLAECTNGREGKIQIPLHKSYQLLHALGDPLGAAYTAASAELGKILTIRNMSLLAHGYEPVKQETFTKMLAIALEFIGIEKENLPTFPQLDCGLGGL